jgi:hypothetical protein
LGQCFDDRFSSANSHLHGRQLTARQLRIQLNAHGKDAADGALVD